MAVKENVVYILLRYSNDKTCHFKHIKHIKINDYLNIQSL
jgi:hypothetical protein